MKPQLKQRTQFSLVYLIIAFIVLFMLQSWLLAPRAVEIPMSRFLQLVREDKVEKVSLTDKEIRGVLKPGALPAPTGGPVERARQLLGTEGGPTVFTTTRIPGVEDSALVKELEDRKSTRLNSSHIQKSRMPSSA